ncbi:MAG TPA: hypothetical protein VK524_08825, partial [Polyangiaceae bacterium]|nr:hypothetical protein [Polyangiaceae bacterium]
MSRPPRIFDAGTFADNPFPFGALSIGSVATKQFWVQNRLPEAVLLTDVTGAALGLSAPFAFTGGSCLTDSLLPPGSGQCSLEVRFAPTELASVSQRIDVKYRRQERGATAVASLPIAGAGAAPDPLTALSTGSGDHSCALLASGNVRCWGDARDDVLGYEGLHPPYWLHLPNSRGNVQIGGSAVQVSAGLQHTCALLSGGRVRCWGSPWYGQLGYGSNQQRNVPPSSAGDVPVGEPVLRISASGHHTCALLEGGRARCWGPNYSGQLGYGHRHDIGDNELPSSAGDVGVGAFVEEIVIGAYHTCARL